MGRAALSYADDTVACFKVICKNAIVATGRAKELLTAIVIEIVLAIIVGDNKILGAIISVDGTLEALKLAVIGVDVVVAVLTKKNTVTKHHYKFLIVINVVILELKVVIIELAVIQNI